MKIPRLSKPLVILATLALVGASCGSDGGGTDVSNDTLPFAEDDTSRVDNNTLNDEKTVYREVTIPEFEFGQAKPTCNGDSDGTLQFGGLLAETGNLAFLGPPEIAAVELAIADVNEAGGVLGNDVTWSPGDTGGDPEIAAATVDRHIEEGADVIVGAPSSGITLSVLEKTSEACKVLFSPANTAPALTTEDEAQMYFRTALSDVAQGQALADLIAEDGAETAALMAVQDTYGEGLIKFAGESLEAAKIDVAANITYDPNAENFDAQVEEITAAEPDAIVIIGFDESAEILSGLFDKGVKNEQIYLVDGNVGNAMGERFEKGRLTGIRGTFPNAEVTDEFRTALLEVDPDLKDFIYAPETYETVVISSLAAIAADSDNPAKISRNINAVTHDGTKCTTFSECKKLLEADKDIAYVGPSGPTEFSQPGERSRGSMAIVEYG